MFQPTSQRRFTLTRIHISIATSLLIISLGLYFTYTPTFNGRIFSPTATTVTVVDPDSYPHRVSAIDEKTKERLQDLAVNNTLTVVPVNTAMLVWAENLLCSVSNISSFDTDKILFWALDLGVKELLNTRGFHTYYNPSRYSVSSRVDSTQNTQAYEHMMLERPKFFIDLLATGLDFLFLDADTVFFDQ